MIFSISFLRALAAMIITNAHYQDIYPFEIIANGGLLGDVIFFAVSGFCLFQTKLNFGRWYLKRVARVYPAVFIITVVYMLLGFYKIPSSFVGFLHALLYPTEYHFVASIVVLYIPYYFVIKHQALRSRIPMVMLSVFIVYGLLYLMVYDKSYYHIDVVREPMIRFLFFESMLLGAHFRQRYQVYCDTAKAKHWIGFLILFVLYFALKMVFVKIPALSSLQISNQLVLMLLLYSLLRCVIGINGQLEKFPERLKRVFIYLSEITLEIYVVQYALIPRLAKIAVFPVNWLVVTATIVLTALALHIAVKLVKKQTDRLV